jgi:site-specific recombinase XerD
MDNAPTLDKKMKRLPPCGVVKNMKAHEGTAIRLLRPIEEVAEIWKRNGLSEGVAAHYQLWIDRFLSDCVRRRVSPLSSLTAAEARRFGTRYARQHQLDAAGSRNGACSALHSWSVGLSALKVKVPVWSPPKVSCIQSRPLFREYQDFRRAHSNAKFSTIKGEIADVEDWLKFLRSRRRKLSAIRLSDADDYLVRLRRHYAVSTVGTILSSLRQFLRFLHSTDRLRHNLVSSIQHPIRCRSGPPQALPWSDVKRILRAVDRHTPKGVRDYAILLLMSLYGLGAAEIIGLTLDQINWQRRTLTVVRPKTGVVILLPLLPAAARALADYLRHIRPPDAPVRSVFVRRQIPHVAFTSSAIWYIIYQYAQKAGVRAVPLGSHSLRHSHASRQVDQQTPPRVLSSILGHQDPASTSIYTRVAVERLRGIALPIPR